jgi:hypothetical protein
MAYDEELADRIRLTMLAEPGLSERKMFGGLAFKAKRWGLVPVGARLPGGLPAIMYDTHVPARQTWRR